MDFVIFTDTSANLPTPLVKEYGIRVIPLSYLIEGEAFECLDTESFDCAAYYDSMKAGTDITTSQINPQKYIDYMAPVLKEGKDILFVGMGSAISGSFASSLIARDQLTEEYPDRKIRTVDSMGASLGEGLLVLEAHECAEKGMSLDETADYIESLCPKVAQIFTVDDLNHLRRGGRLSNAVAILGTLLNIKPLLKGNEHGKIVSYGKVRSRKSVLSHLAEKYDKFVVNSENHIVGISHANCPEDAQRLAEMISANHPPKQILIVEHEPVTGSYLGPGALALYFFGSDDVRLK